MAFGIQATGFNRPNLLDLIEENQTDFRQIVGSNVNVGDNSRIGMLLRVQSNREFRVWQQLEAVYNSQTVNGAEGAFLDEIFATRGVLRRGSSPSTGNVLVETDNTSPDSAEILTSATISATNNIQYRPTTSHLVSRDLRAYKIDSQTLTPATYVFNVVDVNGGNSTHTATLMSNSVADRRTFLTALRTFFQTTFASDTSRILLDNNDDTLALYIGYSLTGGNYNVIGLSSTFQLTFGTNNRIGNRFTEVAVRATTNGFHPLGVGGVTSMVTTPVGFVGVSNIAAFFSGRNPETDAEFFVRAESLTDAPQSSTRPAIVARLLEVDGVVAVSINKSVDSGTGRVTLTPFILGGTSDAVGRALYEAQGITAVFQGTEVVTVNTEDRNTEVIRFNRAQEIDLSVRITYRLTTDAALSDDTETRINNSIQSLNNILTIGSTAHIEQVEGSVYSVSPTAYQSLVIETKRTSEPDSAFSNADIVPNTGEILRFSNARVSYVRTT